MEATETPVKRTRKVDPSRIKTRYYGWIGCAEKIGGKQQPYCVGICADTIPGLILEAFAEAARMIGIGHKPRLQGLKLQCAACNGSGDVAYRKRNGFLGVKPCAACKGQGEFERFEDIDLVLSKSVMIVDDCIIGRD
jgi:hypothetical protein